MSEQVPQVPRSPEQQLALQLFTEMAPVNASIADAKTDIGFNINQMLVDVKDLSVLARKALIGCFFLAATTPKDHRLESGLFDFDLGFFKWLINFSSSNNLAHLKRVLVEAQKSSVQVNIVDAASEMRDKWVSVPLMGPVAIQAGRITFRLPYELLSELSEPYGITMYLSLRIQANFSSIYAQTLFAKTEPLKDQGCTPWMSLHEFAEWMNISQYKWAKDFRYLNRDVIKVALGQINEHSDIQLTLETRTGGGTRRIEYVRFTVKSKSPDGRRQSTFDDVLTEHQIYEILTNEFSMAPGDLDIVMENRDKWTNAKILEAIEYTRLRMRDTKLDHLRKPGNYFLTALKNGYRVVTPPEKNAEAETQKFERQRREQIQKQTTKAAREQKAVAKDSLRRFAELDMDTQDELWSRYRKSPARAMLKAIEKSENAGETMSREQLLMIEKVQVGFAAALEKYLPAA